MKKNLDYPNHKTIALLVILIFGFIGSMYAQSADQNTISKNNIYLDINAGLLTQISVNYERQLFSRKVSWYGRVGLGAASIISGDSGTGGLGMVTMLTGKKKNHFELNAGAFVGGSKDGAVILPLFNVGYRYQKPQGGMIFRANIGVGALGIGFGYAF